MPSAGNSPVQDHQASLCAIFVNDKHYYGLLSQNPFGCRLADFDGPAVQQSSSGFLWCFLSSYTQKFTHHRRIPSSVAIVWWLDAYIGLRNSRIASESGKFCPAENLFFSWSKTSNGWELSVHRNTATRS